MHFLFAFTYSIIGWGLYSLCPSSRERTTVTQQYDSKEMCSKWAHPSAEACVDKGMMRVRRKMKKDGGAEQGAVKYDSRGISMLAGTCFCPLDVAAWRPELGLVFVESTWSFAITLKKVMTFRGVTFVPALTTSESACTPWNRLCLCYAVPTSQWRHVILKGSEIFKCKTC